MPACGGPESDRIRLPMRNFGPNVSFIFLSKEIRKRDVHKEFSRRIMTPHCPPPREIVTYFGELSPCVLYRLVVLELPPTLHPEVLALASLYRNTGGLAKAVPNKNGVVSFVDMMGPFLFPAPLIRLSGVAAPTDGDEVSPRAAVA